MRHLILIATAASALAACGSPSTKGEEPASQRRVEAQPAPQTTTGRTGAEVQDNALNRVVRAVYLCDNGERLSVDFDNPRAMATVRNSNGEAVDLFQQRAADGIWYKSSAYELRGKGILATWTSDGRQPTDCRAID